RASRNGGASAVSMRNCAQSNGLGAVSRAESSGRPAVEQRRRWQEEEEEEQQVAHSHSIRWPLFAGSCRRPETQANCVRPREQLRIALGLAGDCFKRTQAGGPGRAERAKVMRPGRPESTSGSFILRASGRSIIIHFGLRETANDISPPFRASRPFAAHLARPAGPN
ncbi:Hypothetical predicted protein, partial [Olea europaea subsp. europaea]